VSITVTVTVETIATVVVYTFVQPRKCVFVYRDVENAVDVMSEMCMERVEGEVEEGVCDRSGPVPESWREDGRRPDVGL
jgi:hypothetical protein